jgi:hypothetical protein
MGIEGAMGRSFVPQKKAVGGEPFAGRTRQTTTVASGCACRAAH